MHTHMHFGMSHSRGYAHAIQSGLFKRISSYFRGHVLEYATSGVLKNKWS